MAEVLSRINVICRCKGDGVGDCGNNHSKRYGVSVSPYPWGLPLKVGSASLKSSSLKKEFTGGSGLFGGREGWLRPPASPVGAAASVGQMTIGLRNAPKWWEKGLQPNMKEIESAQDLVDSLLNSGDKLVIVDFFSPGCGGCRALHPKICQIAEANSDIQFLQVNYEEHKSMCYSLNVHVLPFFRFYRGTLGRLCSFSCTNATIKKFRDALAKHTPDRCSLGPPRGLEEKELLALAANKDLSFNYTPKPEEGVLVPPTEVSRIGEKSPNQFLPPLPLPRPLPTPATV